MFLAPGLRRIESTLRLVVLVSVLGSCSLAVNADRVQCTKTSDCTSRGGAFASAICANAVCELDPAWACLGVAPPASTQAPPYQVTVATRDLVTQMPFANASIKVCRKLDVDCSMPVDTAVTDANGGATFTIGTAAFAGYLLVEADGAVPTLSFFNPAIDHDQTLPSVSLPSPTAYAGLLFQLGQQPSAGHGNVVISAQDCTGVPAAGVHFATSSGDSTTASFYSVGVGGLPTTAATATDAGGYGGLINVPAGAVTVTGTLESPHADLGTVSLLVREGAITYSRFVPLGD